MNRMVRNTTFMNMRCTVIRFLFICLLLQLCCPAASAQCGIVQQLITLSADSSNGSPIIARLSGRDVQLAQHWKTEDVQWRMDGAGWISDTIFKLDALVPAGVHYVEMMLTARDTVTGDSCIGVNGNYYLTTSAELYASIETNGSGLTQTFTAQMYGGPGAIAPFWSFGDGNTATGLQVTHTYAQPGVYNVLFSSGNGIAGNLVRKIHAGTGTDNLVLSQVVFNQGSCDSVSIEIQTLPPYTDLRFTDVLQSTVLSGNGIFLSTNSNTWLPSPALVKGRYRLPGQSLIKVTMRDANGGDYTTFLPLLLKDSCFAGNDTLRGYFWWDEDADGIKDAQEGLMDSPGARLKIFDFIQSPGEKGTYVMPLPDISGEMIVLPFAANTITAPGRLMFTSSQNLPDFHIGVAASQVRTNGKVYVDMNGDSLITPLTDRFPEGVTVRLKNKTTAKDYFIFTDSNGEYSTIVPEGYYSISVTSPLPQGTVLQPDTISALISSSSPVIPTFRMNPQILSKDLKALLLPHDRPVPGSVFQLDLNVTNWGTDTCKGQFQVAYDPQLQFLSIDPPGGIHDVANSTVTWYNRTLYPLSDSLYILRFLLPAATPSDSLINQAFLFTNPGVTDVDLSNNVYACTTKVGNLQPPFFKSVTPEGEGSPGLIHIHDRLHYRLSFTNTGPGRIQHLILQDALPTALDMSTLKIEWSSHPADIIIRDHVASFRYYDIGLPDTVQSADSARVDLVFSLQPSPIAAQGTLINNTAFSRAEGQADQWSNTTMQVIQFGVGLSETEQLNWDVFPNPFNESIVISAAEPDEMIQTVQITDASGRTVQADLILETAAHGIVETQSLDKGIYFLRISGRKKTEVVKMMKW